MKNGEMIQKVFNCEVCEPIFEDDVIHVIFADKKDSAIGFDWSWWTMEYKEPTIKALGEELRKARKGIADEKVLIGYNLAVAICNKHLGESEDKE